MWETRATARARLLQQISSMANALRRPRHNLYPGEWFGANSRKARIEYKQCRSQLLHIYDGNRAAAMVQCQSLFSRIARQLLYRHATFGHAASFSWLNISRSRRMQCAGYLNLSGAQPVSTGAAASGRTSLMAHGQLRRSRHVRPVTFVTHSVWLHRPNRLSDLIFLHRRPASATFKAGVYAVPRVYATNHRDEP